MAEISFSVNEQVTSSKMNTLCDQLVTICTSGTRPSSPVDGQHIFETDTRQRYTYDSTNTKWVLRNAAVRLGHGDVGISTGTLTTVTWSSEQYDPVDAHSVGSPTRLTIPAGYDGLWLFGVQIEWQQSAQGTYREIRLKLNGSTTVANVVQAPTASTGPNYIARHQLHYLGDMTAGDYLEVIVAHDAGSTINIRDVANGAQSEGFFWGLWQGATA